NGDPRHVRAEVPPQVAARHGPQVLMHGCSQRIGCPVAAGIHILQQASDLDASFLWHKLGSRRQSERSPRFLPSQGGSFAPAEADCNSRNLPNQRDLAWADVMIADGRMRD